VAYPVIYKAKQWRMGAYDNRINVKWWI